MSHPRKRSPMQSTLTLTRSDLEKKTLQELRNAVQCYSFHLKKKFAHILGFFVTWVFEPFYWLHGLLGFLLLLGSIIKNFNFEGYILEAITNHVSFHLIKISLISHHSLTSTSQSSPCKNKLCSLNTLFHVSSQLEKR